MIDQKLARDLYRPVAPPETGPVVDAPNKIPVQRFQALEQQIRNNPANVEPYEELAGIYIQQRRLRDAKRVLEQGTKQAPEIETILFLFEDVSLQLAQDSVDIAAKKFDEYKSDANQRELEQSELECAALQIAINEARFARFPQQHGLLVNSAIALKRLNRVDEAIDRLRRAQTNPNCRATASLNLGICLESRSRVVEALEAYRCAALFRSPPPVPEVKRRALELAASLSERCQLYDSAVRYLDILIDEQTDQLVLHQSKRNELKKLAERQKHPNNSRWNS